MFIYSVTSFDIAKAIVNLNGNKLTITPLIFDNSTVSIIVTVSDIFDDTVIN